MGSVEGAENGASPRLGAAQDRECARSGQMLGVPLLSFPLRPPSAGELVISRQGARAFGQSAQVVFTETTCEGSRYGYTEPGYRMRSVRRPSERRYALVQIMRAIALGKSFLARGSNVTSSQVWFYAR